MNRTLKTYQLSTVVECRLQESVDVECYGRDDHRQEVLEHPPPVWTHEKSS